MKKYLLYILLLTAIIPSCEKQNNAKPENLDTPLISKILTKDGDLYIEYVYNDANLIAEEKSKFSYTKYNYNQDNQLISVDYYFDESMYSSDSYILEQAMNRTEWVNPDNTAKTLVQTFDYNNLGNLIKKTYSRLNTSNTEYLEFTYENDRINKQTGYFNNTLASIVNFYYDSIGNLIKQDKCLISPEGDGDFCTVTEYEFDNKLNPFKAFKQLQIPGKYTNQNNISKETYTLLFEVNPPATKVSVNNNNYEYNVEGLPIRVNDYFVYVYK